MKLTREEVVHLTLLSRLGLSEEELNQAQEQLSNILENFQVLQEVDTSNIPPTANPIALSNIMRKDEVQPSLSQSEILANAPDREEGYFKIKAVLE